MKLFLFLSLVLTINLYSKDNKTLQSVQSEAKIYNGLTEENGMPQFEGNYFDYSEKMKQFLNGIVEQYPDYKIPGAKQFLRSDYFYQSRIGDENNRPDYVRAFNEYNSFKEKSQKSEEFLSAGDWRFLGPTNRPRTRAGQLTTSGTGRANVIRIHPTNENMIWVGSASGGIWRSTNKGQSWSVFDITGFASLGISDIAISKSNPNVVYAATGDKNTGGRGSGGLYNFFTIGILKTTNGGSNWQLTNFFQGAAQANQLLIYKILVHPSNENLVYVSSSNGLFRTTDGGTSWNPIDTQTGYGDIEFHPNDPNIIYTIRINNFASKTLRTYNASTSNFISEQTFTSANRGELAVSPAQPDMVMCLFSHTNSHFRSLERSMNRGGSWTTVRSIGDGINYLGFFNGTGQDLQIGQGWYDLALKINPTNANEIYIGGVNIWKSTNGGTSFNLNTIWTPVDGIPFVHADQHYLEYDYRGTLYSSHDGGVNYTTNGGNTWIDISDGLEITQFYRFAQSSIDDKLMVAGAQDNSTFVNEGTNWFGALGGDGFHTAVDPQNDNFMYASQNVGGSGGLIQRSSNRGVSFTQAIGPGQYGAIGETAAWVTPFEVDPTDPSKVYAGYNNIWVSGQRGLQGTWSRLTNFGIGNNNVTYIDLSPVDNNKLYCAVNNSLVEVNKTSGAFSIIYQTPSTNLVINSIFADLNDPNVVFVTIGGFNSQNKVIRIENRTPTNLTYNLPNLSCNTIVQQNGSGDLFVGMDAGVYKLARNATSWTLFDKGLPPTVIADLKIQKSTGKLRAATYGRGIWEVDLLDCDLPKPDVTVQGKLELCASETVTLTYNGNRTNFEWSNGARTKSIVVNQAGTYFVTIYDNQGCFSQSESFNVSVTESVEINLTLPNNKTTYCQGEDVRLNVPLSVGAGTYLWSTGETSRNITVTKSGTYYVDFTRTGSECTFRSNVLQLSFLNAPDTPEIERQGNSLRAVGSVGNYQWYVNGERITGAVQQNFTPTIDGIYTVMVTNSNNCSKLSEEFEVSWLSVVNSVFEKITVSPNPNNGEFQLIVNTELVGEAELSIIDIYGQRLYSEKINFTGSEFTRQLKLKSLAAGAYFIKIQTDKDEINAKFIVN
jgi:photosystem II stability/assembly factor-like uncharacterized protein